MPEIIITKRSKYGYDIFDIEGEISFEDSQKIEEYVKENATKEYPNVILNLAQVPLINRPALAFLIRLMQALAERKIQMYIMNPNPTVQGLLNISKITRFIRIIKDEESLTSVILMKELDKALDIE